LKSFDSSLLFFKSELEYYQNS